MKLLAIDPGIRGCGVAYFLGQDLIEASYVKNPVTKGNDPEAVRSMAYAINTHLVANLAVEIPRVYQGSKQKGDPNDLLPLAAICCSVATLLPNAKVTGYYPRDWKGTVDPDVMTQRIQGRLTGREATNVISVGRSLDHNIWDAIGIGLHYLGRLGPRRVFGR